MRLTCANALATRQAETPMTSADLALVSCSDTLGGLLVEAKARAHLTPFIPAPCGFNASGWLPAIRTPQRQNCHARREGGGPNDSAVTRSSRGSLSTHSAACPPESSR